MRWFLFVLCGIAGGVLGGMGFGGGTLLIPMLVFFMKVPARLAGWVNLIVFIPTSVVALVFHAKNDLVDRRAALCLLPFALCGSALGLFLVGSLSASVLKCAFGWFLIVIGSISLFSLLLGYFKQK